MIDTDKYEGHTEGPWTPNDDGYVDADYSIAQVLPFVSPKAFLANTQLMADAPLLLAEVKRLRKWKAEVEHICRTMNGPNRDTALFIMTNEVEEE